MTLKLIITVTYRPDGTATVTKNLTAPLPTAEERQFTNKPGSLGSEIETFDTPAEAEIRVEQLVSENGGPDMVKIDRNAFRPKPAS